MANDEKIKTAEQLGEAVGLKIDKLFTRVFDAEPLADVREESVSLQEKKVSPASSSALGVEAPVPGAPSIPVAKSVQADSMDQVLNRIEALVLDLEWDVKVETIRQLALRFQELDSLITEEGIPRTIVNINRRVLGRFGSPGVSPHPMMAKLLQDSTSALRRMKDSRGRSPADRDLASGVIDTYNQIVAALKVSAEPAKVLPSREALPLTTLISHVGGAVESLEEVSQRLARIVTVLRRGREMSDEELTRRLGTVEGLLAERAGRLTALHRELSQISRPEAVAKSPGPARPAGQIPEGLLLVQWSGIPLAIPSSVISALYPLPTAQAEQYVGRDAVPLFGRTVQRYPMKAPSKSVSTKPPGWLIYLAAGTKEYFLLADRALGYRRLPEGLDLSRQNRIKIGETSYAILSLAAFR